MHTNDEDTPFKARKSLGRSPPQSLGLPPFAIESKARMPTKTFSPEQPSTCSLDKSPTGNESNLDKVHANKSDKEISDTDLNETIEALTSLVTKMVTKKRTVTSTEAQLLTEYAAKIKTDYHRLQMSYERLSGRYDEQISTTKTILGLKTDQEALIRQVTEQISAINNKATGISQNQTINTGKASYSAVTSKSSIQSSIKTLTTKIDKNLKTMLIYPKNKAQTSEETKHAIKTILNPTKMGLKIERMNKVRNGGVAIEMDNTHFDAVKKTLEATFVANIPSKRRPKMKLYDVPVDMTDEEILNDVYKQNFEAHGYDYDSFKDKFKILFKVGPRDQQTTQIIIEVENELRKIIQSSGRLYLGWSSCKTVDHFIIIRCFKCQRFGHLAKECQSKTDVCSHCAEEGHSIKECLEKEWSYRCSNCKQAKVSYNHNVNDFACPKYTKERERLIMQTNYD